MGTLRDPLRAAQALRATIRATRQETEESRRLAPQVVEGLIEAGLCRLDVPGSLGGHEAEPVVALQVYEELAWADASVAWIAWNNQFVCLASRYASDAVRTALFSDPRRLFANATRPSAEPWWSTAGFACQGGGRRVRACGADLFCHRPPAARSAPGADADGSHHVCGVRGALSGPGASGHRHPAGAGRVQGPGRSVSWAAGAAGRPGDGGVRR